MRYFVYLQVKIWFQNHRYKYKRQAKEKAMSESSPSSQVKTSFCEMCWCLFANFGDMKN